MTEIRILVVDDEQDLVWAMQHSLEDVGYEVLTAYDGAEALAVAQCHRPDLVVLDIVMPQLDGLQVCHRLRRDVNLAAVPILFLTVRSTVEDRIEGLNEGADDYLVKPFDLSELKARIRALLRRSRRALEENRGTEKCGPLMVGSLTLDLYSRQVCVGKKTAQLTPAEFDILYFFMRHPNKVFSSQQLLQQVWNYPPESADPGLVRWHLKNVRAKIEPDPGQPMYIRTLPRRGYMLKV
jgi:two-component system response regulator RpaA